MNINFLFVLYYELYRVFVLPVDLVLSLSSPMATVTSNFPIQD